MKRLEKEELPRVHMQAALNISTLSVQITKYNRAVRAVTCKP